MRQQVTGKYDFLAKCFFVPFFCLVFLYFVFKEDRPIFCMIVVIIFLCIGIWEKIVSYDIAANKIYIEGYIFKRATNLTNIVGARRIFAINGVAIIKIEFKNATDLGRQITFPIMQWSHYFTRNSSLPYAVKKLLDAVQLASERLANERRLDKRSSLRLE
jgi:hypothetical protein